MFDNYLDDRLTLLLSARLFQPLHDYRTSGHGGRERRRIPGLSKAQRRIKASSTPALLDRDHDRYVLRKQRHLISTRELISATEFIILRRTYLFASDNALSRYDTIALKSGLIFKRLKIRRPEFVTYEHTYNNPMNISHG